MKHSNRRILYIGLGLILISMVLSFGFIYITTLKSPVFLRHCLEVAIPEQEQIPNSQVLFEINYITSSNDMKSVVGITFPDEPDMVFSATENGHNSAIYFNQTQQFSIGLIYGRYSFRTVYVYLDDFHKGDWFGEKELHQADLHFNDGSVVTTDLGIIILYRDEVKDKDTLIMQSASSFSNGSSDTSFQWKDNISLLYIKSSFLDLVNDTIDLQVEGVDYRNFPYADYKSKATIKITSSFVDLHNKTNFDTYDIKPKLYYLTQNNELRYIRIYNITRRRWFYSFKEMLLYLLERGAF